jgi:hypothetical protein
MWNCNHVLATFGPSTTSTNRELMVATIHYPYDIVMLRVVFLKRLGYVIVCEDIIPSAQPLRSIVFKGTYSYLQQRPY